MQKPYFGLFLHRGLHFGTARAKRDVDGKEHHPMFPARNRARERPKSPPTPANGRGQSQPLTKGAASGNIGTHER